LEEIQDYRLLTLIVNALVGPRPWGVTESLTCTVKRYGAAVDAVDAGVPPIIHTPVSRFTDKPSGRVPLARDHVYDPVPPVAVSGAEYGTPSFALGREVVVIASGAGAGEACTVSTVLPVTVIPVTPDNFADMVVLPADTPVASPVALIAAAAFDDAQATRFVIICLLLSE
jgi:hypothetical protein